MGMAGHIAAFSRTLKAAGVPAHARAVVDACRSAATIDIADRDQFYWALRANFVTDRDQFLAFDRAFHAFWDAGTASGEESPPPERPQSTLPTLVPVEQSYGELPSPFRAASSGASWQELAVRKDLRALTPTEEPALRGILQEILAKLVTRPSRRERPSFRGRKLEFRRIFRENVKFGGEILRLVHRERKVRRRKIAFLGDVSGSMDVYSRFFLLMAHGLARLEPGINVYAFSTRLIPLTKRHSPSAVERLVDEVLGWSGGTRIGECLRDFNDALSRQGHLRDTVVVIFSDGWNRGDPDVLRREIVRLKGTAARLYWLNPLKGDPDYKPLCRGMATAVPYLDGFHAAHNVESLARFARQLVRLR